MVDYDRPFRGKNMLTFQFNDKRYEIEFSRKRRDVLLKKSNFCKVEDIVESKHPFTTALLIEVSATGIKEFAKAQVGCHPDDRFVKENGRKAALRALTRKVPIGMRPLIWATYLNRQLVGVSK